MLKEIYENDFLINNERITPVEVMHYKLPVLGYRFGDFAYITDAKTIAQAELEKLKNLDVLVLNALQHKSHISLLSDGRKQR